MGNEPRVQAVLGRMLLIEKFIANDDLLKARAEIEGIAQKIADVDVSGATAGQWAVMLLLQKSDGMSAFGVALGVGAISDMLGRDVVSDLRALHELGLVAGAPPQQADADQADGEALVD
jgi:hypothetical protein